MNYFDLHCDTLSKISDGKTLDDDSLAVNTGALSRYSGSVVQFAVWISGKEADPLERYREVISKGKRELKEKSINICLSSDDIVNASKRQGISALLALEGGYAIESAESVDRLYSDGIRTVALTWNGDNKLAGGAHGDGRLTLLGREVITRMNELGMVADVSHLNRESFFDVAECAEKIAATHTGLMFSVENKRNLSDDQLKVIKQKNGIVGLCVYPPFIGSDVCDGFLRAVSHMLFKGMSENIAFGSDFDGAVMQNGMDNAACIENLAAMCGQSFGKSISDGIFYKNSLHFYKDALTKPL